MSVESDFFQSNNQPFQAANTTVGWSWPVGNIANSHFLGFSIFPDSEQSILTVSSVGYERNIQGGFALHFVASSGPNDVLFRASAISAPNR